jgi:hypothetical protein
VIAGCPSDSREHRKKWPIFKCLLKRTAKPEFYGQQKYASGKKVKDVLKLKKTRRILCQKIGSRRITKGSSSQKTMSEGNWEHQE